MLAHRFGCKSLQEDDWASDSSYTSILSVWKFVYSGRFVATVFFYVHDTDYVVIIVVELNDEFLIMLSIANDLLMSLMI